MKKEVYRTSVAKKLIELRTERDLTSKQVAEATGINHDTYRRYETTVVPPSKNLLKLANFYNVSLDYLTGRENNASNNDYDFDEVGGADKKISMGNEDDYEPVKNDLGSLSETEIVLIKKFRAISEADKIDVANYLSDKEDKD
ncbi:MAG: helix-turn-helix transcriptional regulator [Eubacterium sp.]|nr:helix-turn-helix transcriptional regulator [Eubacterium sp.]